MTSDLRWSCVRKVYFPSEADARRAVARIRNETGEAAWHWYACVDGCGGYHVSSRGKART